MALFPWSRVNREKKAVAREIRFRMGLARVRGYVNRCKETQRRLWNLARKSYQLGDREQWRQICIGYLRAGETAMRWERYLVAAETAAIQQGQAKATGEFIASLEALSQSMMAGATPEEVAKTQEHLERALTRAAELESSLNVVMEATASSVFSTEGITEEGLKQVEDAMVADVQLGEAPSDRRLDDLLGRIEEEMKKDAR